MKKQVFIILAVILMSLSSCVKNEPVPEIKLNPVTEKLIREKITKILDVDGVSVIQKDFKIESNTVEGDKYTIITTVVIVKGLSTFTVKVTLHYVAMVSNYVYTGYDLENLATETTEFPSTKDALASALDAMALGQAYATPYMPVMSYPIGETKCQRSEPHPVTGSFYMTCIDSYKMLETTALGTAIISVRYTFNQGWIYQVDSWSLVAKTQLNDTFDFVFTDSFQNEDTWFTPGQALKVTLNGAVTMTYRSDKSYTLENTMTGTMTTNDKTTTLSIVPTKETDFLGMVSPDSLKLIFGEAEDAYLMIGTMDGMGHCGPASPPSWIGVDADKNYFFLNTKVRTVSPMTC